MASPFAQLPAAIRAHLGALAEDWPDEERSTCGACPLVIEGEAGVAYPFSMARDARCCTAQPNLANFLVGRAGDAAVVRARLANRDGVSAWGIRARRRLRRRVSAYARSTASAAMSGCAVRFGSAAITRAACGSGAARGAARSSAGTIAASRARCRGRKRPGWVSRSKRRSRRTSSRRSAVHPADDAAPDACSRGTRGARPPRTQLGETDALAIVRAVPPADPSGAAPDRIVESPRGKLIRKLRVHRAAIADVLVPAVSAVEHHGDRVLVAGYSTFDAVSAPASVFALLSRLDGATPWRTALAELADPALDEALVRELRRAGALRDPAGSDDPPETE